MYEITRKVILRFSVKWNIPPEVLFKIYSLYRDHAMKYGDVLTFAKGLGIILNRRRLRYLFEQIKKEKDLSSKSTK